MDDLWRWSRDDLLGLRPADFVVSRTVATRWSDNDSYGHVNNAVYYEYFDTVINSWLIERLGDDPAQASFQRYVVESGCRFLAEVRFPSSLLVTHRVERLGTSSVVYMLGVFVDRGVAEPTMAALGRWVHVFVDPATGSPRPIPERERRLLVDAMLGSTSYER